MSTTSHNIAHANTDGFSRQEVRTENSITLPQGGYVLGTGVEIQSIKRSHDEMVEKKLNNAITSHKYHEERTVQLSNVEELFNEINSEGLNKILNRFFNSFRELSTQPENETIRDIVKENARIVVNDFHRIKESLNSIRESINKKISFSVDEINSLASSVGKLNKEIAAEEVTGGTANDLRDQRDLAIRSLGEYFPLSTYYDGEGQFIVNIEGVGSLISGVMVQELITGNTINTASGANERGITQVYFASRPSVPMTEKIKNGTLGAQIKTRDIDIKSFEAELDEMAYGLVLATNAIHRQGFANHPVPLDAMGNPAISAARQKVTGINFFKEPIDLSNASETISLSDDILADSNNIVTGLNPNSPGDNRVSLAISKLQHEKVLSKGNSTFEEHYLKSVGGIGLKTGKSKIDEEQSLGILAQAKSFKERMTGVSLDEEAANMIRYQNAYEASAKVIKASDEMFKTVLGILP